MAVMRPCGVITVLTICAMFALAAGQDAAEKGSAAVQEPEEDSDKKEAIYIASGVIFGIGLLLLLRVHLYAFLEKNAYHSKLASKLGADQISKQSTMAADKGMTVMTKLWDTHKYIPLDVHDALGKSWFVEKKMVQEFQSRMGTCSNFTSKEAVEARDEANFIRCNMDKDLKTPPKYGSERCGGVYSSTLLYKLVLTSPIVRGQLLNSLGMALMSAALAMFLCAFVNRQADRQLIADIAGDHLSALLSTFRFLPSFLLLGLLGYATARWRGWLVNCHTIQARLHDIGVSLGGGVKAKSPEDMVKVKKWLFMVYRYMNTIHGMAYASINPHLPTSPDGYVALGLLTQDEADRLKPAENKIRDLLLTWTKQILSQLVREDFMHPLAVANQAVPGLRGICARHHDLFVRNMPNTWFAMAKLTVDYLVILQVLTQPLKFTHKTDMLGDEDPWLAHAFFTLLGSFCVASAYWVCWSIVEILKNPFVAELDSYLPDSLLCSTDRTLFFQIRSCFDNLNGAGAGITAPETRPILCDGLEKKPDSAGLEKPAEGIVDC